MNMRIPWEPGALHGGRDLFLDKSGGVWTEGSEVGGVIGADRHRLLPATRSKTPV